MKVDRLMSIVLLSLDKIVLAHKSMDMFEVSLRTIYRDIDAIELAGISNLFLHRELAGGFEIAAKIIRLIKPFSTADLSAILIGFLQYFKYDTEDELRNALLRSQKLYTHRKG